MGTTPKILTTTGILMSLTTALHAEELTVSAWGGFFEETLAAEIYPLFTAETGIEVKSIAQPEDSTWMTQLMAAARAKQAPADLSLVVDEVLIRGNEVGLWAELNPANMTGTTALKDGYVKLNEAGNAYAVGALAFYTTFVTNTDYAADAPTSWAELWEPKWDGKLGVVTTPNSGLLEVTATTFFGGVDILETRDGIEQVITKSAELKPQVSLWYRDEDWVVPRDSENVDAAEKFLDFMSRPATQALMARMMGTFPVVPRGSTDLTDEEFSAVGSDITPIRVQTHIHLREGDWLETKYQEMIAQ